MSGFLQQFHAVFGPDSSHLTWWQMSLRAAVIFVAGIGYIRAVGPRTFARGTPLDIVISVVIGSNLSRALSGSAAFLPTLAASAVLVALHWVFAYATRRFPALAHLIKGEPDRLISDGEVDPAALARNNMSHGDLEEELRLKGVSQVEHVAVGTLERSGQFSVLRR